ncbi:MAG: hypothetical protein IMW85_01910 [Thermicanus sp.]|nr:hypothetical protein [Thermicanus sp.]
MVRDRVKRMDQSFCCGASMTGSIGAIRTEKVFMDQVPILYCPVCMAVMVHPYVSEEFELLKDFAEGDQASHITFTDFIDVDWERLKQYTLFWDEGDSISLLKMQIDHALDLLMQAKRVKDRRWEQELKHRLKHLSRSYTAMIERTSNG